LKNSWPINSGRFSPSQRHAQCHSLKFAAPKTISDCRMCRKPPPVGRSGMMVWAISRPSEIVFERLLFLRIDRSNRAVSLKLKHQVQTFTHDAYFLRYLDQAWCFCALSFLASNSSASLLILSLIMRTVLLFPSIVCISSLAGSTAIFKLVSRIYFS
jgi:hypothetical protein